MTAEEMQKVDAAVQAHGQWLTRLRTAIEKGTSEFQPDAVKLDNRCDFGKWLYGEFPATLKATPAFEEIRGLHAKFHQAAGHILSLALGGKKGDALKLMEPTGEFMTLSGNLLLRLKRLKGG
jgi:hypothetical protein